MAALRTARVFVSHDERAGHLSFSGLLEIVANTRPINSLADLSAVLRLSSLQSITATSLFSPQERWVTLEH
jgi:hypothetical protein